MRPAVLTLVFATALVAACAPADPSVVPDSQMSIGISNSTTIQVSLFVNGSLIKTIPPRTNDDVPAAELPGLPWQAELTTAGGRTLVSLTVRSGDVHRTSHSSGGVGQRVDLSCGRLDIYSGPPMLGPMPGPGTPGDCD